MSQSHEAFHGAITYERADQLRSEFEAYHPDTTLFDGLTAASGLAAVMTAPKRFETTVVFDGADYRARLEDETFQRVLF